MAVVWQEGICLVEEKQKERDQKGRTIGRLEGDLYNVICKILVSRWQMAFVYSLHLPTINLS